MTLWYVGGYTPGMDGEAAGILALSTTADGPLEVLGLAAEAESPSYLAVDGARLYAVAEATGRLVEFSRQRGYALAERASAASGGSAPCHITVLGETVLVSNYTDGAIGVHSTRPLELVQQLAGAGSGPRPEQDGPHAHSTLALGDSVVLSADLGADLVHVHEFTDGRLERGTSLVLPAGTGPRDLIEHPSGHIYLLGELGLDVFVLSRSGGELSVVGSIPLPGGAEGDHAAGLSLAGDFVYAALRGSNRIAVLRIVRGGAGLEAVESVSSEGDGPRHHVVDGQLLHVANQLSSNVASFRIGPDGIPVPLGITAVPSPTFLLPAERF